MMEENPNIISLGAAQKTAVRNIFRRLPPLTRRPMKDDEFLLPAYSADLFRKDAVFAEMVDKIGQVTRGELEGLCIHGFPLGHLSRDYMLDNGKLSNKVPDAFAGNPSRWAEYSSQLLSSMIGLVNRKPTIMTILCNRFNRSQLPVPSPSDYRKAGIAVDREGHGNLDTGQPLYDLFGDEMVLHEHSFTMLIGLHSSTLDSEGNKHNPTRTFKFGSDKDMLLEAPIKRGSVYFVADKAPHMRPKAFEKATGFQRMVAVTLFSAARIPSFSAMQLADFAREHHAGVDR